MYSEFMNRKEVMPNALTISASDRRTIRRLAREEQLSAYREGRFTRASTIDSGKAYRRRNKHRHDERNSE